MKKDNFIITPNEMTASCSKCGTNFWKGPTDRYKELLDLIQLRQIRAHYLLDYSI